MNKHIIRLLLFFPALVSSCSAPSASPVITDRLSSPESTTSVYQTSTETIQFFSSNQDPAITHTIKPSQTVTPSFTPDIAMMKTQGVIDPWIVTRLGTKVNDPCPWATVLFSPDGSLLATSLEDQITIWDTSDYIPRHVFYLSDEKSYVRSFAFSSNSELLAAISDKYQQYETQLYVWDINFGELVISIEVPPAYLEVESSYPYVESVDAVAFIPNTTRLALASSNSILLFDPRDLTSKFEIDLGEDMYASEISFSDDSRFMYVLMEWWKNHTFPALYTMKNTVQIWDTENHFLWRTLDFPETDWGSERMSLHRSYLIVKKPDEVTLMMMNLKNDDQIELPYRRVWEYLSSDTKFITFLRYEWIHDEQEKGIEIWDSYTWRKLYVLRPDYLEGDRFFCFDTNNIAINNDNTLMAIQNSGFTYIYDIRLITSQ